MKTEKYQDLLVKYIEKAVAYSDRGEMTIYVNPTDADKKAYLEEKTGFTLSISKEDFIGGIRAVIPERNILVDYAFKARWRENIRSSNLEEVWAVDAKHTGKIYGINGPVIYLKGRTGI